MNSNQRLDEKILVAIPDEKILAATVGTAINEQVAQTAANLIAMYPDLCR